MEAAALVEARAAREAHARGHVHLLAVLDHDGLGEEAAPVALLARVDVAAAAGLDGPVGVLDRVDAPRPVNAGLGRVEHGVVELGVVEPLHGGGGHCVWLWVLDGKRFAWGKIGNGGSVLQFYFLIQSVQ